MLTKFRRRIEELTENLIKEYIYIYKQELKITITEIKNTLYGIRSKSDKTEERISDLEDKVLEIIQLEQKKKKRQKENEDSWISRTSVLTFTL